MLFPLVHLLLTALGPVFAIRTANPLWLLPGLAFLYLFPPICFRIHQLIWPISEGRSNLSAPGYSPWWISLQFQGVFNTIPWVEAILRAVPGAYSVWLRLWGSKIGRRVVWSPRMEIADRMLLEIGDDVVFGHRAALYPHVVDRRKNGAFLLYAKRVSIGARAFIGAGSRLGPGAVVPEDARLPVLTDVRINQHFEEES